MGVGPARLPSRPGSLTLLAVIAAVSLGMPAVDRELPASRTVASGIPFPVGAGVTVVPPAGATIDLSVTRPGVDHGTASFLMGPVRYAVVVDPYPGTVEGAAYRVRNEIFSSRGYQVSALERFFVTDSGLIGRRGRFTAWGRGGLYAVIVVDGLRIEVTASGADPRLRVEMGGIEASIRSLAYHHPHPSR